MLKKVIFSLVITALAAFIFTCKGFSPQDASRSQKDDELVWSDVVYTPDGQGITIYLDGSGEYVKSSRALNLPLAKLGHDFFEVSFSYPVTSSESIVARTFWESGQKAGITGIHRTPAGIDYSSVSTASLTPGGNAGAAVLFVGRKEDKTLLAVGYLAQVDSNTSGPASTLITSSTRSVTFKVDALKAGAKGTTGFPAGSSFLTNAKGNPVSEANTAVMGGFNFAGRVFPLFILSATPQGPFSANYTFLLEAGDVSSSDAIPGFNQYGIIRAAAGTTVEKIKAQYTLPNGEVHPIHPPFEFDGDTPGGGTTVTFLNTYFNSGSVNPVEFSLNNSTAKADTLFGLAFSIGVHALSTQGDPVRWYLRPGYGKYLYDLDNGLDGAGGAVLIGTGLFEQDGNDGFAINRNGQQTYNEHEGWTINLDNLQLAMMKNGMPDKSIDKITGVMNPGPTPSGVYVEYQLTGPGGVVHVAWTNYASFHGTNLQLYEKGNYLVNIRYYDGVQIWEASYQIYVGDIIVEFNPSDIPEANRRFIITASDLNYLTNTAGATSNQKWLLVVNASFDISNETLNSTGGTFIFLAGNENIIIGRAGSNSINNPGGNNQFYFGRWPYSDPVHVGGNVVITHPFTINAGGTWQEAQTAINSGGTLGARLPGNSQYGTPAGPSNSSLGPPAPARMFTNTTTVDVHEVTVYSRDLLN